MSTVHSGYTRDQHDWYVEPEWCVESLFRKQFFGDGAWIHDPCCGQGTIPDIAKMFGYNSTGSDIVDRASGRFPEVNFLYDDQQYNCIVTNPPYRLTKLIIEKALKQTSSFVAVIVPIKFLASQKRYKLFMGHRPKKVIVMSRRPSMPPGGQDIEAKGGSVDYCWIIWNHYWKLDVTQLDWSL